MLHHRLLPAAALVLAGTAAATALSPLGELVLKEKDHKDLGEEIAAFVEAKKEGKGMDDARQGFLDQKEKIEKKLRGVELLSLVHDLEEAFYYSNEYTDRGVKKGKLQNYEEPGIAGATLEYAIWTPKKYSTKKGGPYPLILLIPEEGESGKEHEKPQTHIEEWWVDTDLRNGAILVACGMPKSVEHWGSLNGVDDEGNDKQYGGGAAVVLQVLKNVTDTMAVDVDRIFIAGYGTAGATAALQIANLYPDRFAGVIGRAGDVKDVTPDNFRNVATLFAGGGAGCTAFKEAADALGHERCTLAADALEKDIWAWVQATERNAHPTQVSLVPASPNQRKAYWIQLERFDPAGGAKLDAVIDRENNRIEITAEKVESLFLYFNDLLVDMDRPINVVCNGVEDEAVHPRNWSTMLDLYFSSNDSGRIYTNYKRYEIEDKASE